MKPISPHDPLDDLIAAALHGELSPEERTQFDSRLNNDSAARAAYQEARLMHDLLEKTHRNVQPDPAFEQRMVSGVRRKIQDEARPRETAWESLLAVWALLRKFPRRFRLVEVAVVLGIIMVLAGVALGPITNGIKKAKMARVLGDNGIANPASPPPAGQQFADANEKKEAGNVRLAGGNTYTGGTAVSGGGVALGDTSAMASANALAAPEPSTDMPGSIAGPAATPTSTTTTPPAGTEVASMHAPQQANAPAAWNEDFQSKAGDKDQRRVDMAEAKLKAEGIIAGRQLEQSQEEINKSKVGQLVVTTDTKLKPGVAGNPAATEAPAPDTRKLVRNAELELEVKSFQAAMDQIAALTKAAGGYVDTSHSQKGGNGKLQGTVVVKVLPQNLDDFLLKLRDLGKLANQSVKTDDVTKDYFDTQARLENSRRMETQLQDLLKHENSKVSDLLQVERELARGRGDIEQMQGALKLYDFQVQYATVTMQVREKDLNQAAAYLLKEQDEFSLFATNVEETFQKARETAENFKAQILAANLNHNSGSDVSAELTVMVAPEQIEPFLTQVRGLGRVANFTRQTQRVAKDGGDSDQPADETLTDKDKVQVHVTIRSDDESRKQVALTVVTPAVDGALEQAKTAALAQAGAEILSSSLNKTPQGQSTAQLSVRVPGKEYSALIDAFHALGRTASLSIQRNDNSGPGANGDDAPVIVSLALTDEEAPLQETEMSVLASGVDSQAQQIKQDAAAAGVVVKASSFQRQPDGTEMAQMTFRLPMSSYPAFVERLKKSGKVESLTVNRQDRPDQARADGTAPVEISLRLHNQGDIVADNNGLWATLRATFGEGTAALFGSVRVIGVLAAFLAPWVFATGLLAWVGRRIYVWRRK